MGLSDLGQFHHKPLKDINGSVVLATVNNVKDTKSVALSSGKWVSFGKLLRRSSGTLTTMQDPTESDVLVSSLSVSISEYFINNFFFLLQLFILLKYYCF